MGNAVQACAGPQARPGMAAGARRSAAYSDSRMAAQKQVSYDCGKVIRKKTDDELVTAVQEHAQQVHDMDLKREEVLSMAEVVAD